MQQQAQQPSRIEIEIAISAAFVKVYGRDPCRLHSEDHVPLATFEGEPKR